jgi:hypothetical protein
MGRSCAFAIAIARGRARNRTRIDPLKLLKRLCLVRAAAAVASSSAGLAISYLEGWNGGGFAYGREDEVDESRLASAVPMRHGLITGMHETILHQSKDNDLAVSRLYTRARSFVARANKRT